VVVEGPSTSPGFGSVFGRGLLEKKWKHQTFLPVLLWAWWVSTLLGPERTACGLVFLGTIGGRLLEVSGGRLRFVWSLRIVQWTRASFVSVHICVVIS
jgi:hypothetical protein